MSEFLTTSAFWAGVVVGAAGLLLVRVAVHFVGGFLTPWVVATTNGAKVGFLHLLGMRLRGTPASLIIEAYVVDQKRDREYSLEEIEGAYLGFRDEIQNAGDLLAVLKRERARTFAIGAVPRTPIA